MPSGKRLTVDSHGQQYDIAVDEILVGVGRRPNVEGLDLDTVGVAVEKTGVKVNDRLQTTNPRIYAAGDICSPYKFTHAADFQARIVIQNALFLGRAKASALTIPWCTYTDPEIAHVGMYEREAQTKGLPVRTFVQELGDVDRAVLDGETEGFVKVLVRAGTDKILGATVVARHAGEMLPELTLAIGHGLGLGKIASTIHSYPTQAEAIRKLGDAVQSDPADAVPQEGVPEVADLDSVGPQKTASSTRGSALPPVETRPGRWRPLICVLAIATGVVLVWALGVYEYLRLENLARLQRWVDGLGPWAPVAFVTAYIAMELLFVPALPLTILAGIAFGPLWGTVYTCIAATISAALAFLITRHGGRQMVERWIAGHPRLARIDEAVARHGWYILAFTRLVPIFPFNLQNYAYGLTAHRIPDVPGRHRRLHDPRHSGARHRRRRPGGRRRAPRMAHRLPRHRRRRPGPPLHHPPPPGRAPRRHGPTPPLGVAAVDRTLTTAHGPRTNDDRRSPPPLPILGDVPSESQVGDSHGPEPGTNYPRQPGTWMSSRWGSFTQVSFRRRRSRCRSRCGRPPSGPGGAACGRRSPAWGTCR